VSKDDVKHVLEVDGFTYLTPDELEEVFKKLKLPVCTLCMRL